MKSNQDFTLKYLISNTVHNQYEPGELFKYWRAISRILVQEKHGLCQFVFVIDKKSF